MMKSWGWGAAVRFRQGVEMVFVTEQRPDMRSEPPVELNTVVPVQPLAQQVYMDLFLNKLLRVNAYKRREQVANNMFM